MTRKDYELIADTLRYCSNHCDSRDEDILVGWVGEHIADALKRDNPRFDYVRFMHSAFPVGARA